MSFRCWGVKWIVFITPSRNPQGFNHQGVPPLSPAAIIENSGLARLYHALSALAIRDKRIYVFGTPQVPSGRVAIFLDVEGRPDEGFVYLIGMVIARDGREDRHSFWAD